MATCKSEECGAEIIWGTSLTTGKPCPLDAKPTPTGNMVLLSGGKVRGYTDEDARLHRERYVSHFVTCIARDSWRK